MTPTVACVVGTRPEAVKMAPVIHRLRRMDAIRVHGPRRPASIASLLDRALRRLRPPTPTTTSP